MSRSRHPDPGETDPLLLALERREVKRPGGTGSGFFDCRVIAATRRAAVPVLGGLIGPVAPLNQAPSARR